MVVLIDLAILIIIGGLAYVFAMMGKNHLEQSKQDEQLRQLRQHEQDWICIAKDVTDELYRYKDDYIIVTEEGNNLTYKLVGAIAAKKHHENSITTVVTKEQAFGEWDHDLRMLARQPEKERWDRGSTTHQVHEPRMQL